MNARELFVKAMFVLLDKYTIEKISVDMVLEQSDLSRGSFYRYFQDKYQLMTTCYASYADMIIKTEVEKIGWTGTLEKTLNLMFENKRVFENMFKSEGHSSFVKFLYADSLHKLRKKYMEVQGCARLTIYETHMMELYISGVVICKEQWVKRGMDLSSKDLAVIILDSMPEKIKIVVNPQD